MRLFPTRANLVVDLFLVLLILLLPLMLLGVRMVRRGRLKAHAAIMVANFAIFCIAVVAFEIGVRLSTLPPPAAFPFAVHLVFALPCFLLWIRQIVRAKHVGSEPAVHRRRGRLVIVLLAATVATGFWLYVASYV